MKDNDNQEEQLVFGFAKQNTSPAESTRRGLRWRDEAEAALAPPVFETYDELVRAARACTRCGLREGCRQVVVGGGSPEADIMFVGEGPGAEEDRIGKPFVGRAGKLLDRILEAAGFKREQVYITNAVLCRPPGNRTPTRAELRTCSVYLEAHVELIEPRIIVAMGSTAAQALIGPNARITRLRGKWHEYRGIPLIPTFHPAALLRDPGKKRLVWEDFRALRARFDELLG